MDNIHRRPPPPVLSPQHEAMLLSKTPVELAALSKAEVSDALEKSYDAYRAMECIGLAGLMTIHEAPKIRTLGLSMIDGVNKYFLRNPISLKALRPDRVRDQEEVTIAQVTNRFEKTKVVVEQMKALHNLGNLPLVVFLTGVEECLTNMEEGSEAGEAVFAMQERVRRLFNTHPEIQAAYSESLTVVSEAGRNSTSGRAQLLLPEKIIAVAQKHAGLDFAGAPNLYRTIFNGVALSELFFEKNSERFCTKAIRFITGVPKGDAYWNQVIEGIFFSFAQRAEDYFVEASIFKFPGFMRNILAFRNYMAERLAMPALTNTTPDARFDQQMQGIFPFFSHTNSRRIVECVVGGILHAPYFLAAFQPQLDAEAAIAKTPLTRVLMEPIDRPRGVKQHALHIALRQGLPKVAADLQQRFKDWKNIELVARGLDRVAAGTDGWERGMSQFIRGLETWNDGKTYPARFESPDAAKEISAAVAEEFAEGRLIDTVRHFGDEVNGTYSIMSSLMIWGLGTFHLKPLPDGTFQFLFTDAKDLGYISGTMDSNGGFLGWDGTFESKHESLMRVLLVLAGYSFQALQEKSAKGTKTEDTTIAMPARQEKRSNPTLSPREADEALRSYLEQ